MYLSKDPSAFSLLLSDISLPLRKAAYVLTPRCFKDSGRSLLEWDLKGPFVITIALSLAVYFPTETHVERGKAFSFFFAFHWIFAAVCSINAVIFGSKLNCFAVTSIIIYLQSPLCIVALLANFLPILAKVAIVLTTSAYSLAVTRSVLRPHVDETHWIMVFKPIFIYYLTTAVTVISN